MTLTKSLTILAVAIFAIAAVYVGFQAQIVGGESFTGTATNVVSATSTQVGPDSVITLFAINALCDSRIVTTKDEAIRIGFRTIDGFTVTNTVGHLQAASTTVAYDSGLYGCGAMTAIGLGASSTITISETQ